MGIQHHKSKSATHSTALTIEAADSTQPTATNSVVGGPPDITIPSIPEGFVPVNPADLKGYSPMQSEIAVVADTVLELKNFTDYAAVFGVTAPEQAMLVKLLTNAAEWSTFLTASANWLNYVKSESGLAWKDALSEMEALKAPFQLAVSRKPSITSQYPSLTRFIGAQKVIGKRAAASRAKKKKSAATAPVEATAASEAATPATDATDAKAKSGTVVNVQG